LNNTVATRETALEQTSADTNRLSVVRAINTSVTIVTTAHTRLEIAITATAATVGADKLIAQSTSETCVALANTISTALTVDTFARAVLLSTVHTIVRLNTAILVLTELIEPTNATLNLTSITIEQRITRAEANTLHLIPDALTIAIATILAGGVNRAVATMIVGFALADFVDTLTVAAALISAENISTLGASKATVAVADTATSCVEITTADTESAATTRAVLLIIAGTTTPTGVADATIVLASTVLTVQRATRFLTVLAGEALLANTLGVTLGIKTALTVTAAVIPGEAVKNFAVLAIPTISALADAIGANTMTTASLIAQ